MQISDLTKTSKKSGLILRNASGGGSSSLRDFRVPNDSASRVQENRCSYRARLEAPSVEGFFYSLVSLVKRTPVIALALTFAAQAQADQSVVKGQLTFNSVGIGQIAECGTTRVIEFGTMASSPYFQLTKEYETLSADGRKPVLVEVEGRLVASLNGKLVLEGPRVVGLKLGGCSDG